MNSPETPHADLIRFELTARRLRAALKWHAQLEPKLQASLARHGFPQERRQPPGFATLVRALAGQQLSVKAAATIYGRVLKHCDHELSPERVIRTRETTLRRLGLSERKAASLRKLARSVLDGTLQLDAFTNLGDEQIIAQISAVPGFGVWSAQMYLIFSLGRPDVWPIDDLGVRQGLKILLALEECPTAKSSAVLGERHSPRRSSLALFCWHVRNNPTL